MCKLNRLSTPDGTCLRDYIHADARAHVLGLQGLMDGRPKPNLGTGFDLLVREVIETVRRVTGRSFTVREPKTIGDPPSWWPPGRARELLGFGLPEAIWRISFGLRWNWSNR